MIVKTEAVILIELIEDLKNKRPPSTNPALNELHSYNVGVGNDFDILRTVSDLCNKLHTYIPLIPKLREANRQSFESAIHMVRHSFSVVNLGNRWDGFLNNLNQPVISQSLYFFDHLISSQDFWESRSINAKDSQELLSELDKFIAQSSFPNHIKRVLNSDIMKMRFIINNLDQFGEQDYWDKFQKITGIVISLYDSLDECNKKDGKNIIQKLMLQTNHSLATSANIATIAQAALPLLLR